MEKAEYKKMDEFETTYWWHIGKLHLLEKLISLIKVSIPNKSEILEIGCGTGIVSKTLSKYGTFTGIDMSEHAIEASKEKGVTNLILGDINTMDIKPLVGKFDLVLALDVLEHIQDDCLAIRKVGQLLKSNGYFVINVPAHKFLWSEHDEALHHKRRYSRFELKQKLEDNGFDVQRLGFFVTTFFPVIAFFRVISSIFSRHAYPKTSYIVLPKFLNSVMAEILKFESSLIGVIPSPIGTTIYAIAKKVS